MRLDAADWGLDHGTWLVLVHAFPAADVPVVQLSIDARQDVDSHVALGAQLAQLRRQGALIIASGNVVHNLRTMNWSEPELGFDWAQRFDDAARETLLERPADVARLTRHADFARSHPTPDHFLPLLYFGGIAGAGDEAMSVLVDGMAYGSVSMAGFRVGEYGQAA